MFSRDDVARRLTVYIAVIVNKPSETISPEANFGSFDMDSVDAVEMAMQMEREFGCEVDPELFLQGDKTVAAIAETLSEAIGAHQ